MGTISFEPDNTFTMGASFNLPLFAPAVYSNLKLNKEQMRGAVESARASRINMINDVRKAFYNILLAEQSLEVLLASEKTIQQTVDETRTKYDNGLASEYDLITAEVQLSNLRPTIIQTRNSIKVANLLLKMYLSMPEDVEVNLLGSLDDFKTDVVGGSANLSTDITANSDLRNIEIQEDILNRQYRLAKTSRMPTLGFYTNFNITADDFDVNSFGSALGGGAAPAKTASSSYRWQKPLTIGVQLSVPIFSGLKNVSKERQIRNNISQLQLQRDYLQESIGVEVKSAINATITAREQMYANEKTVGQAQKAYDISNTRYGAGAGTILELNTAQLSLTQAKLNYTQAIYDYLSAHADYEKIIGNEK